MDRCPACEREFKGIGDFPRVYIVDFTRKSFPEAVGDSMKHLYYPKKELNERVSTIEDIPNTVLNLFKETGKYLVVYEGKVWERTADHGAVYQSSDDITSSARRVYDNPILQRYLESLRGFIGREIRPDEIFPNWEHGEFFKDIYFFKGKSGFNVGNNGIQFTPWVKSGKFRTSNIELMVDGPDLGLGNGPTMVSLMPLGLIMYEGRINPHS